MKLVKEKKPLSKFMTGFAKTVCLWRNKIYNYKLLYWRNMSADRKLFDFSKIQFKFEICQLGNILCCVSRADWLNIENYFKNISFPYQILPINTSIGVFTLHKKWSFPLKISPVNVTGEIFNAKFLFLCSVRILSNMHDVHFLLK